MAQINVTRCLLLAFLCCCLGNAAAAPATMRAVRELGACQTPFRCVHVKSGIAVPSPKSGEALIRVNGSSVNPSDVDTAEGGGCIRGCGADVAGTVVACPNVNILDEINNIVQ